MKFKEEKIVSFQQPGTRLQLLRISSNEDLMFADGTKVQSILHTFQVRLNRRIIYTSVIEFECRKLFAIYVRNIVLQLKIC